MPLFRAARTGSLTAIRRLLAAGTPVDSRDAAGRTPLMAAARHGRPAAVDLLLAAGADPNRPIGEPPRWLAAAAQLPPLCGLLLTAGAAVEAADLRVRGYLRRFLRVAGLAASPAEPVVDHLPAVRGFPQAAESPTFREAVARLAELTGREPQPYRRRRGVVAAFLGSGTVRRLAGGYGLPAGPDEWGGWTGAVVDQLQAEFRGRGFVLVTGMGYQSDRAVLQLLFPTPDPLAVVRAAGTNGVNSGLDCDAVVAWLRRLGATHPWVLTGVGFGCLDGHLVTPLPAADAVELAEAMREFCPDIGDLVEAAEELRTTGGFGFWWD